MARSKISADVRLGWDVVKAYIDKNGKDSVFTSNELKRISKGFNGHSLKRLESQGLIRKSNDYDVAYPSTYLIGEKLAALEKSDIVKMNYNSATSICKY